MSAEGGEDRRPPAREGGRGGARRASGPGGGRAGDARAGRLAEVRARAARAAAGGRARVPTDPRARVRLAALLALGVLLLVLLVAGARALLGGGAPPLRAFDVLPREALVAVSVATDRGRPAVDQLAERVASLPSLAGQRDDVVRRLTPLGCDRPIREIEGEEVGLAVLETTTARSASLLAVDTGQERDDPERVRCGRQTAAYVGRFLLIGPGAAVDAAVAREAGRPSPLRPLSEEPTAARLLERLPQERAVTAWASPAGVRRLLAPQGGLAGGAGALLDRDGLEGAVAALRATDEGVRLTVRTAGEPGAGPAPLTLLSEVPAGVLAAADVRDVGATVPRLLEAFGAGEGVTALLPALAGRIEDAPGIDRERDLDPLARAETAIVLTPGVPAPTVSAILRLPDGEASVRSVARVRDGISRVLRRSAGGRFARTRVGGREAFRLPLGDRAQLVYLIDGDRLLASSSPAGVEALLDVDEALPQTPGFAAIGGDADAEATSVGYLDFSQLLALGEQTGLGTDPTYRSLAPDLRKVRAAVLRSTADGGETTSDLDLWIP